MAQPAERLDATFMALANPTRRAIILRLRKGEAGVMELAEPFSMSQPAITKHIKVLERAGLVSRERQAQLRLCRLEAEPLMQATEWLQRFADQMEERFEQIDALLDELQNDNAGK